MSLLAELRDARLARDDVERILIPSVLQRFYGPEAAAERKMIRRLYLGRSLASIPDQGRKFVAADAWPVASSEVGRDYLRLTLTESGHGPRRYRKDGRPVSGPWVPYRPEVAATMRNVPEPQVFRGHARGELAVVDITTAYWSLLATAGPDVWFVCDGERCHVGWGRATWHRPAEVDDKNVQHAIVGMMRKPVMGWFAYGQPREARNASLYLPGAIGLMMFTLAAIATESVERFGCVHWMVDAAMIPAGLVDEYRAWLWERWRLGSHVVACGRGEVWGINTWRIEGESRGLARRNVRTVPVGLAVDTLPRVAPGVRDRLADFRGRVGQQEGGSQDDG